MKRGERFANLRGSLDVLAGLVLMVLGALLVVSTERGLASYWQSVRQHGGAVVDLGQVKAPPADLQGRLVRVVGVPLVSQPPADPEFGQRADTPLLTRHVQMFQWHELRMGGAASYELDWLDSPQDSRKFAQPRGHDNPGAFPIDDARFLAGRVQLDGYTLDDALVRALPGSVPVTPDPKTLPAHFAATFSLHGGALVTSDRPDAPHAGDLRVSWSAVPLQEVTVLARVQGDRLAAAPNAADGPGYEVNIGDSPLLQMRPDLAGKPRWSWTRRVLAVLLAAFGAGLLLQRRVSHVDHLRALGGGLLMVGAFAIVPWLASNRVAVMLWLLVALIGLALLAWRWRARQR